MTCPRICADSRSASFNQRLVLVPPPATLGGTEKNKAPLSRSDAFSEPPEVGALFILRGFIFRMHAARLMNILKFICVPWILIAIFLGPSAYAETESEHIGRLARSQQWLRLLHYGRSFPFWLLRSRLDGPDFFLAKDGRKDPEAELRADIEAFSQAGEVGRLKQHPQCAFPERYRWLKEQLGLKIKDVACPLYEEFQDKFNARSATFVFSSAYPSNPSSMFGHAFLRVNSNAPAGTDQKKLDVLDFGINYAASVDQDENGAAYAWLGLTGGYHGSFVMQPYYFKIAEYSNSESRDIWEYDLSLTTAETRRLIAHVWELETTSYFDYFFFDENCAYQTLTLLEAVRPDWNLSEFGLYVAPSETVKRLSSQPGAVTSVRLRPSLRKKMLSKYARLTAEQKEGFHLLVDTQEPLSQVSDKVTLEAGASYLYYEKERGGGKLKAEQASRLHALLVRRSELGAADPAAAQESYTEESRPESGHSPYRFGLSGGVESGPAIGSSYFSEFELKLSYHDLLNLDLGYLRFSQIDFMALALRYHATQNELAIEKLDVLSITSLFPISFLERRHSWRIQAAYISPKDLNCQYCHLAHLEGGIGAAVEPGTPKAVLSAMLLGQLEAGSALARGFRWGPKAELAALANPLVDYKIRGSAALIFDAGQANRQSFYSSVLVEQSYSARTDLELRGTLEHVFSPSNPGQARTDASFTLNLYY